MPFDFDSVRETRQFANTPFNDVVWAGEFHPGSNPKPDVQVSKHPAFQMFLDYGNASALGRMPPQSIAADASGLLLRLFPQSSLDHFHVHRKPSRLVNPVLVQRLLRWTRVLSVPSKLFSAPRFDRRRTSSLGHFS